MLVPDFETTRASRAKRSARSLAVSTRVACSLLPCSERAFTPSCFHRNRRSRRSFCFIEAIFQSSLVFSWIVKKSHDKAITFPKLHVMTIHQEPCSIDGIVVASAYDKCRWAEDTVVFVDQTGAICRHDICSPVVQAGAFQCSQPPTPGSALPVILVMWGF